MAEKRYTGFSVEDLLHDQEFVSAVKGIKTPEEQEQFLLVHYESRDTIIAAHKFIQLFETSEGKLDEERKHKLWNQINKFNIEHPGNTNHKRFQIKTIVKIAASILIMLSLGDLLYLHFNKAEIQYRFSDLRKELKTDQPLIVLSNGTKIQLEKNESNITVLKGQDALQINNDSIVKNQTYVDQNTGSSKFIEVIIPFGKKSKLVLEDGTIVWLNAGSRFAFPSKFDGKKRIVNLDGEAYFEVAKNVNCPFIVSTDMISIEVLGTKFNVSSYHSDNLSETVLLEGKVNIWENGDFFNNKISMLPNQRATCNKTDKDIIVKPELEPQRSIAWVEGWYEFTNEKLENVLKKLERYYNIRFEYDQNIISKTLPVSGKLDLKDSLDEVMVVLSEVTKFKYRLSENTVYIKNN